MLREVVQDYPYEQVKDEEVANHHEDHKEQGVSQRSLSLGLLPYTCDIDTLQNSIKKAPVSLLSSSHIDRGRQTTATAHTAQHIAVK